MNKNEFDQLFKEKFDQYELPYNRAGWEQLSRQLPADSRKVIPLPWLKLSGIAAALLIAVSTVAWLYNSNNRSESNVIPVASTSASPHNSSSLPENTPGAATQPATSAATATPAEPLVVPMAKTKRLVPQATVTAIRVTEHPQQQQPAIVQQAAPEVEQPSPPVVHSPLEPRRPATSSSPGSVATLMPDAPVPSSKTSKNSFSLTGGMNYGSLNTGYMAGVNARRKLGSKVFIEGDLGIVSNSASQTFTPNATTPPAGGSAKGAPIDYRNTNLVYVQVNPTLGYQVLKNVSVGVGADMQRMLNGSTTLVNVNDEVKSIPETDIGLTGKTEIAVSRRLKAGVLYREGINNFVNSSNEYFDRRYLQVQLKLTVFGK